MGRKPFGIAGYLDNYRVDGVGQPVQGAVDENGVVEKTEAFLHGLVAGDDEAGDSVAVDYELAGGHSQLLPPHGGTGTAPGDTVGPIQRPPQGVQVCWRRERQGGLADPVCPGHAGVGDTADLRPSQVEGQVERAAGTFQARLVTELRLNGVSAIGEANLVIQEFLIPASTRNSGCLQSNRNYLAPTGVACVPGTYPLLQASP